MVRLERGFIRGVVVLPSRMSWNQIVSSRIIASGSPLIFSTNQASRTGTRSFENFVVGQQIQHGRDGADRGVRAAQRDNVAGFDGLGRTTVGLVQTEDGADRPIHLLDLFGVPAVLGRVVPDQLFEYGPGACGRCRPAVIIIGATESAGQVDQGQLAVAPCRRSCG
jgi:hypothetical protein